MATDRVTALAAGVRNGERAALARAITLVESARADHRADADRLLADLLPHTGGAIRVGVSGPPGAGKSTFIEALGLRLCDAGRRVAVLAVDPSSTRSGGSILGDKTRMVELGRRPEAFIRPSPSGGSLGGVARRTREVLLLCEAAGFDTVLVETVGVGQSEVAVADLVDLFAVLVAPGGGDDLQGIKRGIMELADLVVVNKADGDLRDAAGRIAADYQHALHLMRARWTDWACPVLPVSSVEPHGLEAVWEAVQRFHETVTASGELAEHRRRQAVAWMWSEIDESLLEGFRADPAVVDARSDLEDAVADQAITPSAAARRLLEVVRSAGPVDAG